MLNKLCKTILISVLIFILIVIIMMIIIIIQCKYRQLSRGFLLGETFQTFQRSTK